MFFTIQSIINLPLDPWAKKDLRLQLFWIFRNAQLLKRLNQFAQVVFDGLCSL